METCIRCKKYTQGKSIIGFNSIMIKKIGLPSVDFKLNQHIGLVLNLEVQVLVFHTVLFISSYIYHTKLKKLPFTLFLQLTIPKCYVHYLHTLTLVGQASYFFSSILTGEVNSYLTLSPVQIILGVSSVWTMSLLLLLLLLFLLLLHRLLFVILHLNILVLFSCNFVPL